MSKCWKQEKSNWSEDGLFSKSQLCLGAPDSVRCARLAQANLLLSGKINGVRLKFTGLYGMHRTVSGEPTVAGPTVGRLIRTRRVAEPTARRGHRTVRCAPDSPVRQRLPDMQRSATVGCAVYGKKSGTGQCPVCTGLSGAPDDRRQGWPSRFILNGS